MLEIFDRDNSSYSFLLWFSMFEDGNNFNGRIPENIGDLKNLEFLNLSKSNIYSYLVFA